MTLVPTSPLRLPRCFIPRRLIAGLVLLALFGAACSSAPRLVPSDSTAPTEAEASSDSGSLDDSDSLDDTDTPAALAFVEEDDPPSAEFCTATANIWVHSAALNMLGEQSNKQMTLVALANVAEWLERSTFFDDEGATDRTVMFEAFSTLRETVTGDFDHDWQTFQASTAYTDSPEAQIYETERDALVPFITDECDTISASDLRTEATDRTQELIAEFTAASTAAESDALPGHLIFTHSSGRLIASFPSAWSYEEDRGDAIVDLVASPKVERFLAGEAVDGIHIQLVEAGSLDDFRGLLDQTMVGSTCERISDVADDSLVRRNITQTFDCPDHAASIIGQYNEARGLGLIIEASFDRPRASRADLIRLASIANSALWS